MQLGHLTVAEKEDVMDGEETAETPDQEEVRQEEVIEGGFPFHEIDVNSREENPILDMFG